MNSKRRSTIVGLLFSILAAACGSGGGELAGAVDDTGWPLAATDDATAEVVRGYARIVEASYADTVTAAEALDTAIEDFVASPSQAGLRDARKAWRQSREPYLQTESFRFYDGPIDNPQDGPEGLINGWPLDENYIDYVEGDPEAGIINGDGPIDAATLEALNEDGGEKNIATGYHAIEFLLWGQDMDDDGPGARPYTDYVTSGEEATAANQQRRAHYLQTVSAMLVDDLTRVRDAWQQGADYRVAFEAGPRAAFGDILTGMIVLSGLETGGERLQPALDTGDQEDEHSCFSDNTHRDMVQDVQGMMNVWGGSYIGLDGDEVVAPGLHGLVAAVDADLADRVRDRIAESLALAMDLRPPFDREIAPDNAEGRERVRALIESLDEQETVLTEVFRAFGLSVPEPQ